MADERKKSLGSLGYCKCINPEVKKTIEEMALTLIDEKCVSSGEVPLICDTYASILELLNTTPACGKEDLLELIKEQVVDEAKASKKYAHIAQLAADLGFPDIEKDLRKISYDESQHHGDLGVMSTGITGLSFKDTSAVEAEQKARVSAYYTCAYCGEKIIEGIPHSCPGTLEEIEARRLSGLSETVLAALDKIAQGRYGKRYDELDSYSQEIVDLIYRNRPGTTGIPQAEWPSKIGHEGHGTFPETTEEWRALVEKMKARYVSIGDPLAQPIQNSLEYSMRTIENKTGRETNEAIREAKIWLGRQAHELGLD